MSEMVEKAESERLAIERERLRVEKLKFLMLAELVRIQQQTERRANRSLYDRFEDALFDW